MKFSPVGIFHTIIPQEVVGSPGAVTPVLYLRYEDGSIAVHTELYEYLLTHRLKSLPWKRTRARVMGLFWDFLRAIQGKAKTWEPINLHRAIYRRFCEALLFGTIDLKTKMDPLGLHWPATEYPRARTLISAFEDFITWVSMEAAGTGRRLDISTLAKLPPQELAAFPVNAELSSRFIVVAQRLKQLSMMSHLKNIRGTAENLQARNAWSPADLGPNKASFDADPAVYMAPELVAAFLEYGFVKDDEAAAPEEREDITAKMIFLLLAFGGVRISEPYHLWFNDVVLESTFTCKVLLRHPADAQSHILGERCSRKEYLARRGLLPRNLDQTSGYHAGWKNLATDKSLDAPIYWIHSAAEAEFSVLYVRYLTYRRLLIEKRRLRGLPDHPFLFVSAGEDRCAGISHIGDPYSMAAMGKSWDNALHRISKVLGRDIPRGKRHGTTLHAPRHFYGQALSDASTHKKIIQKGLRQRSILSQATYTAPDFKRVTAALSEARKKIEGGMGGINFSPISRVFGDMNF